MEQPWSARLYFFLKSNSTKKSINKLHLSGLLLHWSLMGLMDVCVEATAAPKWMISPWFFDLTRSQVKKMSSLWRQGWLSPDTQSFVFPEKPCEVLDVFGVFEADIQNVKRLFDQNTLESFAGFFFYKAPLFAEKCEGKTCMFHSWSLARISSHYVVSCVLLPPAGGPGNFIYMQLTDTIAPSKTGEDRSEEVKVARLASLPITTPDFSLCMSFWYHMAGEHAGALHISYRNRVDEGHVLWTRSGHQGSRWREGRVVLPRTGHPYQVKSIKTQSMKTQSMGGRDLHRENMASRWSKEMNYKRGSAREFSNS